jgi:hypothetical protein
MNALLEVHGVTKVFAMGGLLSRKSFEAVHDVSFSLEATGPRSSPSSASRVRGRRRSHG